VADPVMLSLAEDTVTPLGAVTVKLRFKSL